jgi:hypothetical protein
MTTSKRVPARLFNPATGMLKARRVGELLEELKTLPDDTLDELLSAVLYDCRLRRGGTVDGQ